MHQTKRYASRGESGARRAIWRRSHDIDVTAAALALWEPEARNRLGDLIFH